MSLTTSIYKTPSTSSSSSSSGVSLSAITKSSSSRRRLTLPNLAISTTIKTTKSIKSTTTARNKLAAVAQQTDDFKLQQQLQLTPAQRSIHEFVQQRRKTILMEPNFERSSSTAMPTQTASTSLNFSFTRNPSSFLKKSTDRRVSMRDERLLKILTQQTDEPLYVTTNENEDASNVNQASGGSSGSTIDANSKKCDASSGSSTATPVSRNGDNSNGLTGCGVFSTQIRKICMTPPMIRSDAVVETENMPPTCDSVNSNNTNDEGYY